MSYRIGDEVVLKVDMGRNGRARWQHVKVQIIGLPTKTDDGQYICYVPNWLAVPMMFRLSRVHLDWYDFHPKFLGEQGCFITDESAIISHHPTPVGECCDRCKRFTKWAERGDDGFTCRRCRENPWR